MKKIYTSFFITDTYIGRVIRALTHNVYSHVTLSLDPSLTKMHSISRINKSSPVVGGFVTEYPSRYLKGGKSIGLKLCEIEVSDEKYDEIVSIINDFALRDKEILYNHFDLLANYFGRHINIPEAYTCCYFVACLLGYTQVVNIKELEDELKTTVIYIGDYANYLKNVDMSEGEEYFAKVNVLRAMAGTISHLSRLSMRMFSSRIKARKAV